MTALAQIAVEVAATFYNVSAKKIMSRSKKKTASRARFAAWYAIRTIQGWSHSEIGNAFNRDRSAVTAGIAAITANHLEEAEQIASTVARRWRTEQRRLLRDGNASAAAVAKPAEPGGGPLPEHHGVAGAGVHDLVRAGDSGTGGLEVARLDVRRLAKKSAARVISSTDADPPRWLQAGILGSGTKPWEGVYR